MSDNVYKNKNNGVAIRPSVELDEPLIVLGPQNRRYFWVFAVLFAGLLCSMGLFVYLMLSESGVGRQPVVSGMSSAALARDVEMLKRRTNLLITGAMESKIGQLEHSLQSGIISHADLVTIQELKEDLNALKSYSSQNGTATFGLLNGLEKMGGPFQTGASLYSDEILHEISNIKNLFYISIASWGVAIVVFGGTWLRGYFHLRQIQNERTFRHRMLEKPKAGIY